jgi:hypothetical protein
MPITLRPVFIVAFVVAVTAAAPSEAQNLLTNPGFNNNTNGWSGAAAFDGTRNHPGSSGNGSARFVSTPGVQGFFDAIEQCVAVVAGGEYSLGGSMMVDAHPANADTAQAQFAFFSGANCSGGVLDEVIFNVSSDTVGWASAATEIVAPAGTASLRVLGRLDVNNDTAQAANYDDFFVILESAPVPTLPMTMFIVLAIAAIGMAAMTMARRKTTA